MDYKILVIVGILGVLAGFLSGAVFYHLTAEAYPPCVCEETICPTCPDLNCPDIHYPKMDCNDQTQALAECIEILENAELLKKSVSKKFI